MDPLHFCVAVAPLSVYLLMVGLINLSGWPFVTTGTRDTAALGIGIIGLVIAGPMELFFPGRSGQPIWRKGLVIADCLLRPVCFSDRLVIAIKNCGLQHYR